MDDLRARREATFLAYVAPPAYQAVSVTYSGKVRAGYAPAEVLARANAALADYLDPQDFGRSPAVPGSREWAYVDRIRRTELYTLLNGVDGVDYVNDDLTLNGVAADLVLTGGVVVLPTAGTMTGALT
jgi:hypothetical protein